MTAPNHPPLGEEEKRRLGGLILLDRVVTQPQAFHAALLEQEDDALLDTMFKFLLGEDLVKIADDDFYQATEKGTRAYQNLLHQQQSYLMHFDIFSRVDLADGTFAEEESDFLDDSRWSDLRVSVGEYKGIDAYRMVFLGLLADEHFFEDTNWKFDLALGSTFFTELEDIVASQLAVGDLAYVGEDGGRVSGEAVMEDVILQGSRINKERMERDRQQQTLFEEDQRARDDDDDDDDGEVEWAYAPYDPWVPMAAYAGSAMFVEALWLSAYW
ncbi:MAG: hypothetical protein V3S29_05480 [bacterium]